MKVWYNLLIKNILGQIPPVLVTAGKREEEPPQHILTLQRLRYISCAEKYM